MHICALPYSTLVMYVHNVILYSDEFLKFVLDLSLCMIYHRLGIADGRIDLLTVVEALG